MPVCVDKGSVGGLVGGRGSCVCVCVRECVGGGGGQMQSAEDGAHLPVAGRPLDGAPVFFFLFFFYYFFW